MMNICLFLSYIILAYGLSNMVVYSSGPFKLFENIRSFALNYLPSNLGELFECMICFPTWVGIILSIIDLLFLNNCSITPFNIFIDNKYWYFIIIFDALFTSGIVWLIHTFQEMMERVNNDE